MNAPNEIMTEKEVAEYLKCSRQTLYRLRIAGEGPKFFKVRGSIKYRRDDVVTYTNEQIGEIQ